MLIARALQEAPFETDQGGDLYLRMAAERAIKGAAGGVRVALAGRDGSQVGRVSFLGARFTPDLVVETPGGASVAVTVTLLRGDAAPVGGALATALALAAAPRYGAVVALLLDRRLARRDPFADPLETAPGDAGEDQEATGGRGEGGPERGGGGVHRPPLGAPRGAAGGAPPGPLRLGLASAAR